MGAYLPLTILQAKSLDNREIVGAFLFLYLFTGRGCAGGENTILRGNTLFYGIRKMRAVRETRKAADGRFQIFSYLCSGFRMTAVVFCLEAADSCRLARERRLLIFARRAVIFPGYIV